MSTAVLAEAVPRIEFDRAELGSSKWRIGLRSDTVDVWMLHAQDYSAWARLGARMLDPAEREQAKRLRDERDRCAFMARHGLLRLLLGNYLDVTAASIALQVGPFGKPELAPMVATSTPGFNISHTDGRALIAVAPSRMIGVDIQRLRSGLEVLGMARLVMTDAEVAQLASVGGARRLELFLTLWTRREACLKALGVGLGWEPRQLVLTPSGIGGFGHWTLPPHSGVYLDLPLGLPWFGCIAVDFLPDKVRILEVVNLLRARRSRDRLTSPRRNGRAW